MFVLACSLLSSYTEYARKRRLQAALKEFFQDPASLRKMIVCRAAAHRLTLLSGGAGFSSWGGDAANGSLARVASAPALHRHRSDEDINLSSRLANCTIYRSECAEVVALPDESLASCDWRLFSSSLSAYGPSTSTSVFFIAASEFNFEVMGESNDTRMTSHSSVAEEVVEADDESSAGPSTPSLLFLDSTCMRIGWNRSKPAEALYACDSDTFSEVVFAWTNGRLRSSFRKKLPISRMRTVWLAPSSGTATPNGSNPVSPPPSQATLSTRSSREPSPHSPTSSPNRSCNSIIARESTPRPLLQQLFFGDSNSCHSFSAALTSALSSKVGSNSSLNLVNFTTMPRRTYGRRSHAFLPSLSRSVASASVILPPPSSPSVCSSRSIFSAPQQSRLSRSSLRRRTTSPLAIDLPRRREPASDVSPRLPPVPSESLILCSSSSVTPSPSPLTLRVSRSNGCALPSAPQTASRVASSGHIEKTTQSLAHSNCQSESSSSQSLPVKANGNELEKSEESLERRAPEVSAEESLGISSCTVSPSITVSSHLDDDCREHSLAEARVDDDSEELTDSFSDLADRYIAFIDEELEMPSESARSSGSRRIKTTVRRHETAPHSRSARDGSRLSARAVPPAPVSSPMLDMLRRKMSSADHADIAVDPQLQRLTTIELLQRRRHSHVMHPSLEGTSSLTNNSHSSHDETTEGRRRSLSPMALQKSLRLSGFGSGELFKGSGSLFDSARRGTSRRMHSATRDKHSDYKPQPKPPTVLVYTAGQKGLYNRIRDSLAAVLRPNVYTVFHLSPEAIKRSHWVDPSSACLLLASTHELDDRAWAQLQDYFNKSGKIIFVCQNSLLASLSSCDSIKKQTSMLRLAFGDKQSAGSLSKDLEGFLKKTLKTLAKTGEVCEKYSSKDIVGGLKYAVVISKKKDSPLLLYMESGGAHHASAVFSDATCEQLIAPGSLLVKEALERVGVQVESSVNVPSLSIGYFIADLDFLANTKALRYGVEMGGSPHIFMRRADFIADHPLPTPQPDLLPVQVVTREDAPSCASFDSRRYFSKLKTLSLGQIVLFVPVTTTTMDVSRSLSDALPGHDGILVVARQQLKGQGRGGNEFISPAGVAMFTFNSILPASSSLARNPSFLQHVVALSVVMAATELSRQEEFPLRIKWPNDFYFNRSHKVGGCLITARTRDDCVEFTAGVGINVSNSRPTTCLNDMLPEDAPESANFIIEEVIAATLNKFEQLVNLYENEGQKAFLDLYYNYWLHSREEVTLGDENEKVVIRGLDQHGFLEVRSRKHPNKLYSVSDDGNTFDMMKGLIRLKIK